VRLFIAVSIISCLVIVETTQAQVQLSRSKDERLFKKGIELVEHANYGAARQVLSEFIDMAPASDARRAEAEYYIAYCAVNLGHSDGEKLIENFISNNPSNPRSVTAYYDLGNFFYNDKNYNKAIVYYKKVNFSALPLAQQTEGRFRFGYSFFNLKKLDEALEQFNFVKIQNSSYTPAANYYAGFIEYSKGLYGDALTDLKRAESSSSYAPIVPYLIANVYYKQRQYDELIRYADGLKNKASSINNYDDISMLVADA
jgi:tetratricopeptide (TPR) repeat protein